MFACTEKKKAKQYTLKMSYADVQTHAHTHIKRMASQGIRVVCMAMNCLLADTQMVKQAFDEQR